MLIAARKCQTKKSPQLRGLKVFYYFTYRLLPDAKSFPLNRRRWLTADVIHHAGNTVHFVDDAVRHAA
ncbi:hypothetical protein SG72_01595 [Enterobacter cloacae subsp. cloacae]|nr:hypothetical protein SG72_01595 [Enterobacter cloacae subsp. cloacae]